MRSSTLRRKTLVLACAICVLEGGFLRSNLAKRKRVCWTVSAGAFFPQAFAFLEQKPQCQKRKRDVRMPAHPTTDFSMSQACCALGGLEHFFDALPRRRHAQKLGQRRLVWRMAQGLGRARRLFQRREDEQLRGFPHVAFKTSLYAPAQGLDPQGPLRAVPHGQGLPVLRGLAADPFSHVQPGDFPRPAYRGWRARKTPLQVSDQGMAWDFKHVVFPALAQGRAERSHAAKLVSSGAPAVRHRPTVGSAHSQGALPVRKVLDVLGNRRLLALGRMRGQVLGPLEAAVQGGLPLGGGLGEKHGGWAVLDFAQSPAPWALHAAGSVALLGKGGASKDP